jgi:Tol biopolymer transport system component
VELSAGSKLGSYEILAPVGAGGMGEVYRARDTRLGREVALKALPRHLTENAEARQRFEREARTVSRLSHPNICTLYDVGHSDGIDFLVMEYLEGETLASRLEKGPFKPDDLLAIATQVADALGMAHREGVIHRDLKPGNIMLTRGGAKLLDFGLAKDAEPVAGDLATSPTVSQPLTAAGTIVGTMRYMAPEQLEGKPADARSDIFSFGAVLYEMATGKQAFGGESAASVIAAVMEQEPTPISTLDPLMPPALDRLVRLCLAKNPEERLPSADGLKLMLEWIQDGCWGGVAPAAREERSRNRERVAWLVAAVAVLVAAALVAASLLRHAKVVPAQASKIEAAINLPAGLELDTSDASLAFSPDGRKLVVAAAKADGKGQLWLRATDGSEFRPLAGTDGAMYPFWSPDGRSIGFFADQQLKRINLSTGSVFTICAASSGRGGTWNREGTIVFAPEPMGGLYQVPAAGGTPIQLSVPQSASVSERLPHFLPGGRRLLFYSGTPGLGKDNGIYVLDLGSGKSQLLMHANSGGRYVARGYLAFMRDGNLMVQRFHARTLRLSGQPFPVAQNVSFNPLRWNGEYAFSSTGLLVYEPRVPVPESQLIWFSLEGKKLGTVGEPAPFVWASVSPDGNQALVQAGDGMGHYPLWIYDLKRGTRRRFTTAANPLAAGVWSRNGRQIVYEEGSGSFYRKSANGLGVAATQIFSRKGPWSLCDWSPDGRLIAMGVQGKTGWDIWMLPLTGDRKPYPFIKTPYNEAFGTFSSHGRWFSYISDESGRNELYVTPFPGRSGEQQVSSDGAEVGGWVPGRPELAYITPQGRLMIVEAHMQGKDLQLGKPRMALGGRPFPVVSLPVGSSNSTPDWFSPDGKKVLLPIPVDQNRSTTLTLVTNWRAGLTKE